MKKMQVVTIFLSLACCLILGMDVSPAAGADQPIVIGFVHTLSGPVAMYGKSGQIGGEIAVEEINAAGGVLGRPLKMLSRDDKLSPEVGLREAKSLVLDEKADFLTGTISSSVGQAISEYCRSIKKIFIATNSQSSRTTEEMGHRYVFRISTNTYPYHGIPAEYAAKKWGSKKLCVCGPDYEWGKVAARDFVEIYKKFIPDAEVVREVWVPLGTNDYTPFISTTLGSGAELLQHSFYGGMELAFTKQAFMMGLFKQMHVSASCAGDAETWYKVKKGEPYPENALATSRYPYYAIKNPQSRQFVEKFNKKSKVAANYAALDQYIAVYALADVIKEVGTTDSEKIIDALEDRMINAPFDPPLDKVKIRACDHQAMLPTWVGTMGFRDDVSFPALTQITVAQDPETTYRTCAGVKTLREQARKEGLRIWEK